jgi:hypothetical protein
MKKVRTLCKSGKSSSYGADLPIKEVNPVDGLILKEFEESLGASASENAIEEPAREGLPFISGATAKSSRFPPKELRKKS